MSIKTGDGLTVLHTAGSNIAAGTIVDMTGCVGAAYQDIASGEKGPLAIVGEVQLAKESTYAASAGAAAQFDTGAQELQAAGGVTIGVFAEDVANGETTGKVILNVGI